MVDIDGCGSEVERAVRGGVTRPRCFCVAYSHAAFIPWGKMIRYRKSIKACRDKLAVVAGLASGSIGVADSHADPNADEIAEDILAADTLVADTLVADTVAETLEATSLSRDFGAWTLYHHSYCDVVAYCCARGLVFQR